MIIILGIMPLMEIYFINLRKSFFYCLRKGVLFDRVYNRLFDQSVIINHESYTYTLAKDCLASCVSGILRIGLLIGDGTE